MNIGILTGGGDCPGLNAVIRAVVRKAEKHYGTTVFGFHDGWKGILDERYEELTIERMRGTLPRGGTILGTTRDHPYICLLYTSPSPRDGLLSRMPSSA